MKTTTFRRQTFHFTPRVLALLCGIAMCAHAAKAQFANSRENGVFNGRKAILPAAPSREELEKQLEAVRVLAPKNSRNAALQRFKIEQAQLLLAELAQFSFSNEDETRRFIAQLIKRAEAAAQADGDAANLDVLPYVFSPLSLSPQASQTVLHERAYLAENDGSTQPFWVFLPREYSPKKKYPLAVFLHGYNPVISKVRAPIPGETLWRTATQRGLIVAVPYGRRNTDFLGIGEDDVLRVLAETKSLYNIDDDRVFLTGFSMGGFGTLAIGLKNPDLFAGLAAASARTDIYRWLRLSRAALPSWKRTLHEADDPRHLAKNALNLPILLQHGARDTTVPVEHSRVLAADLRALKSDVFYREDALASHELGADSIKNIFGWTRNRKRESAPRRIIFTTANLRTSRAYWAQIKAFREYSRAATIEIGVSADGEINVKTDNVAAFTLSPPTSFFTDARRVLMRVNGEESALLDATTPIHWREKNAASTRSATTETTTRDQNATTINANRAAATTRADVGDTDAAKMETPNAVVTTRENVGDATELSAAKRAESVASTRNAFPIAKTSALCGPIREAYRGAFLLVYGTRGTANVPAVREDSAREYSPSAPTAPDAATRLVAPDAYTPNAQTIVLMTRDEANARRFAREWRDYADGTPQIKADTQITPDDEKNFNLILFGDSRSNAILARIGAQLPLELTPDGYRIGTREVKARGIGLQFCYPSPFSPARLVVVQSGLLYGDALALNHKFDLLPDFLVFGDTIDARDTTNDALAAGFFDENWQLPNAANAAS